MPPEPSSKELLAKVKYMDTFYGSIEHKQKYINSLGRSLTKSFAGSMNASFKQAGFLEAYYNFQYSNISPNRSGTPGRDMAYFSALEDQFCRDFSCCGLQLKDMHELLQHFEDTHVLVESDMEDEEDLQFQFDNQQDQEMAPDFKPVAPSDIYQNDNMISAFETSIIRKRQPQNSPPQPWRTTIESPPQMFPLVLEGPTKFIKIENGEEVVPEEDDHSMDIDESNSTDEKDDRPYKCKIIGCNKAYKNPGGLKYHMQHGHCEDTGDPEMNNIIHKPYQCTVLECGKRYKNLNGLKYHIEHAHSSLLGPR